LIVEFLLFVHEVSSLAYCQEGHVRLSSGEMLWLFMITFNEAGLCFREVNSIKLVLLQLSQSMFALSQWSILHSSRLTVV